MNINNVTENFYTTFYFSHICLFYRTYEINTVMVLMGNQRMFRNTEPA